MKKQLKLQKWHISQYANFLLRVNHFDWAKLTNMELKSQLQFCDQNNYSKIYSLLKEIILRCTGLILFDTQIAAAYSMQQGNIAELPTGEGKTLAAVLTAACFALQKKRVHILTFNDYLSKRDYKQTENIFRFCNLTSGFITEESSLEERRRAYSCNVVYISAKQAGFDYLKNFLCNEKSKFISIPFDVAIVDEADSIFIDEARIPLVVAGSATIACVEALKADYAIQKLYPKDIVYNNVENEFWLTDSGIANIEKTLDLNNLYDEENVNIVAFISAAIEARYLVSKDKDYLVKDNEIFVIDQITGRIAVDRKFPAILHQAVEIKEKLTSYSQTIIYNSMPLQFFLLKYKLLCGMTGTVESSKKEIKYMYGLDVDVISPHLPSIRKDYADYICDTEEEKENAIILQIKCANDKGQPILLGTQSVLESERYSKLLSANFLPHNVLNARNNEMEAEIIADAGKPYKITISTNMAGRGVDIKLGGRNEEEKKFVKDAGGLFVIGCGINESLRIDRQLKGRSGRQGDPGESKFFVSKEDPLLSKYFVEDKFESNKLPKLIRQAQKLEDGKAAEARYMLEKYAYILEVQRQRITAYRDEILLDNRTADFLKLYNPELFKYYVQTVGIGGINRAEKQLTLYFINQHWADYLCTMENIRSGIHLSIIGGLNPIDEYHKSAVSAFSDMEDDIKNDVLSYMKSCTITAFGIDMEEAGLVGATSTCTYIIDESKTQFVRLPHLLTNLSNGMNGTLFSLSKLFWLAIKILKINKFI
ncbi:preprotein translocase subunit SecA [Aminipila sp.]|uniref:preprotein translocase subunit SecA n=1 Tax=Aminipila sp. TaxID=2060095 RepID=UPI00289B264C|nr:DEAD/DEAH box helicase [Aminipila sp.]